MPRNLTVIGNWKMYKTSREASDYIEQLIPMIEGIETRVMLAVPFTSIASAAEAAKQSSILIGAQNMNDAREGAFTGEIAAMMLKEAGAEFVILGHSERRHLFGESDELIRAKVLRALQDDLSPVLCVGETQDEREEGRMEEVLSRQIESALSDVSAEDAKRVILAYEPVWAIGSGLSATPKLADEAHAFCRKCLGKLFGARKVTHQQILYGGSVKPSNTEGLVSKKHINGVLVGGASLDAKTFAEIIQHCENIQ